MSDVSFGGVAARMLVPADIDRMSSRFVRCAFHVTNQNRVGFD